MFAALQSDSSEEEEDDKSPVKLPHKLAVDIPAYEDLSSGRADEETVLKAVYGDDFQSLKGVWGCPNWQVTVRPVESDEKNLRQLKLQVQLTKQYPYVVPTIKVFDEQKALSSKKEVDELVEKLKQRAAELASSGSVMMVELVQVAEDFLMEHRYDPNMSAWEQMKARELAKRQQEQAAHEEMARLMDKPTEASSTGNPLTPTASRGREDVAMIEKEMARQREALVAAREQFRKDNTDNLLDEGRDEADDYDVDDDLFDFEDDDEGGMMLDKKSSSRYLSDFVEMGVLGRGGGGEVVKAKNRLDRRIYAVKKILLEPEHGNSPKAKAGAIQNKKLRREVTTISRMTHKNIVRYYQAWVESDNRLATAEPIAEEDDGTSTDGVAQPSSDSDGDSCDEGVGFWTNSPLDDTLANRLALQSNGTCSSDDEESSFSDESFEIKPQIPQKTGLIDRHHTESIIDLLEHEQDTGFQSPLMTGLGFQDPMYKSMYKEKSADDTEGDDDDSTDNPWEESSVKVGNGEGKAILYIQMEYCATTLRKLIDDLDMAKMPENDIWRLVRQILEALAYLHSRNVIHRDLKPGNVRELLDLIFNILQIFLDAESNVKIGDFGLATRNRGLGDSRHDDISDAPDVSVYDVIEDIRPLLGDPVSVDASAAEESMTGGVGTTYYRAPEQEGKTAVGQGKKSDSSYTNKADLFSFGVILFEMFHPPFSTYMERADTLMTLRGDKPPHPHWREKPDSSERNNSSDLQHKAERRFPASFVSTVPKNAQQIILWCLERDPKKRPSAEQLLSSELLPGKNEMELEILDELFERPTQSVVDFTFDTDVASRAYSYVHDGSTQRSSSMADELLRAIADIRAGAVDASAIQSIAMNASSLVAATSALKRARNAGKLGKSGKIMLKRAAQRTAGILAMRAAASAAVTGAMDGVHGTDPDVLSHVCNSLRSIFQLHGAVQLRCPLLRPRPSQTIDASVGGPAEVINRRGTVLLLPEDLTGPFARAVARGGSATSHLKRFDIQTVYHKSMTGGHPRETLEASFDIIYEDPNKLHVVEAETIKAACEVLSLLPSHKSESGFLGASPIWYLRLNHTRLADAILDLCGVSNQENLRQACFSLLTRLTAPTPHAAANLTNPFRERSSHRTKLESVLSDAVANHGMSVAASKNLTAFIEDCLPLPTDATEAIGVLQQAVIKLRTKSASKQDARRSRRFEDAANSLKSMLDLLTLLERLGLRPSQYRGGGMNASRPFYISLDLGLRQRRKHYHGGMIFQCIVLPQNFFSRRLTSDEHNEAIVSSGGRGMKIAEGGNYSELVRKNRPPGNFASSVVNQYTAARIPVCVGVSFPVGKIVELLYLDSTLSEDDDLFVRAESSDKQAFEVVRQSLGHPLQFGGCVRVLVTGIHGLDAETTGDRFFVASRLWSEGIAAEYLPHSGVVLSLVKRLSGDSGDFAGSSDLSLLELQGACALLRIPFIVIVQPHLLRDKNCVRLRQVPLDSFAQGPSGTSIYNDATVSLEDLPSAILAATSIPGTEDRAEVTETDHSAPVTARDSRSHRSAPVQCIYVDNDTFISSSKEISKNDTPHYKTFLKGMKSVKLSAESFLSSLRDESHHRNIGLEGIPVFAVTEVSFFVLRDFGTELMRQEQAAQSASGACVEIGNKYPKHKRVLKTLAAAIDNYMKQEHHIWTNNHRDHPKNRSSLMTMLLYSKVDDRFDMVTLNCSKSSAHSGSHHHSTSKRR